MSKNNGKKARRRSRQKERYTSVSSVPTKSEQQKLSDDAAKKVNSIAESSVEKAQESPSTIPAKMSWRRRGFNALLKNWKLSATIAIVPSLVGLMHTLWEMPNYLKWFSWLFALLCAGITALRFYFDHIDQEKRINGEFFYQSVIDFDTSTKAQITQNVINSIYASTYTGKCLKPFPPFENKNSHLSPEEAIRAYAENLQTILQRYFGPANESLGPVGISLFMSSSDSKSLIPLYQNATANSDLPPSEICKNGCTLHYVMSRKNNAPLFESKLHAYQKGHYKPAITEVEQNLKGSIYCHDISLYKSGNAQLNLYLCVVTYDNHICDEVNDIYSYARVIKLFGKFESELKREVANILLYEDIGMRIDKARKGIKPA